EVREEGTAALAEADENLAFLVHVLAAQPCAAPIAPQRSGQRREPALRQYAADALERFGDDAALCRELRRMLEVLQGAAAADAEMTAARRDPLWRCAQHLDDHRLVVAPLSARAAQADGLAGQRA